MTNGKALSFVCRPRSLAYFPHDAHYRTAPDGALDLEPRADLCRSLDGIAPLDDPGRTCATCRVRTQCTPQLRLDLFVDAQPFRLLLAWTSAKNFLLYEARLRQRSISFEDRLHRITVINRGSWGELRFHLPD